MGRLEEVREEIEQLCEEIEQEALRARPLANSTTTPNAHIRLQLRVPRDVARRLKINISLEHDDDSEHL